MAFSVEIKTALSKILGEAFVKDDPVTCYSYRADSLTLHPAEPMGVVFPATTAEVAEVVGLLAARGISFLPRGAGTGLSGGAIPSQGSVLIEMARFREIEDIDLVNRTVTVGAGVVNIAISDAVAKHGLHFVPDPSSQKACSVGGNVAENSGGPHTLKYGVTVNHVLGLEMVMPDGEIVKLGGKTWGVPGPDLLGLVVGSEGTFAIVTKVICRLTPLPEKVMTMLAVFPSLEGASKAVSGIIAASIVPAALEMIDNLVIRAVERAFSPGFPTDAAAILIIELEDLADGLEAEADAIGEICRANGAGDVRFARDEAQRVAIWRARKEAFGALGGLSPSFYTQDGVIPRSALPRVLNKIIEIGNGFGFRVANLFHAGDGNLHPLILYDDGDPQQVADVIEAGNQMLAICLAEGGSLSGEHGIGLEKAHLIDRVFNSDDLENMRRVHGVFNPSELLNPGKIFPTPGRCAEVKMARAKSGISV